MRNILIVGAGQAGLQVALGLKQHDYEVTVVSNRTPEEIRTGKVMSSQCMFDAALQTERDIGANLWEKECPPVEGLGVTVVGPDGGKALSFASRLDCYAQAVDQRVKMPGWIEELERRGGKFVVHDATIEDLESYVRDYELVIIAAGKGDIAKMFERDPGRSPYATPQRALALTYVKGLEPRPEYSIVDFNLIPGVGEFFVFPALTTTGPCEIFVFEGIPDGPMDCWGDVTSPEQHLERSLEIFDKFLPWEAERAKNVELTDPNGILSGRFPPTVRRPVGHLPSGGCVLGIADVVVLNDPITGQGSNNAAKCAAIYLDHILEHGDLPYDQTFMENCFERYWAYAEKVTMWTNALLGPPPPHVLKLLGAAHADQRVAHRFANGFNDPSDFFGWFMDPIHAEEYLASLGQTGS